MFEMKPVVSSQISAMGHDPVTSVMKVQFKNGATYSYANVPTDVFEGLLSADSVGSAFSAQIKKNPSTYPATKD